MSAQILDGKVVAANVRTAVRQNALALAKRGVVPCLAVVLVGDDPASQVYVAAKSKAAKDAAVLPRDYRLPVHTTEAELCALLAELNADAAVHGILLQMPLPPHLNAERILATLAPHKDVDGLHPLSLGLLAQGRPAFVPCTPRGVMHLLRHAGVDLTGARAVVVGRSVLVGKPMGMLLANANATVVMCHSKTKALADEVRRAQVVIAAVGRPEMIRGEWLAEDAVVIDVGINRGADGKLRGDVAFAEAVTRVRAITPVPGGVGPMTIACLLENTVDAAMRALPEVARV